MSDSLADLVRKNGHADAYPPAQRGDAWEGDKVGFGSAPIGETPKPNGPNFPDPVPCSALRAVNEARRWLWERCISPGAVTLLSAHPKAGKTTLIAHLLRALGNGASFAGLTTAATRVLYVTEENESRWAERRDGIGIDDHCSFIVRPFSARPDFVSWILFLEHVERIQASTPFDLIVFDTLSNLWPVAKENDAADVGKALTPLHRLASHAALLLVHHLRKSDGQEGTASRGSGALAAWVDAMLELRRYSTEDRQDRRRVLTGYGRWDDVPDELVLELRPEGYVAHGDRSSVVSMELRDGIIGLLPNEAPGIDVDTIRERWTEKPAPGRQRLFAELSRGVDAGDWNREGKGVRGSRHTYWVPPPD